jgi:LPS export ABC transporter protein LptC
MMAARSFLVLLVGVSVFILAGGCEERIKPSVLPGIDPNTLPQQESWNSIIVLSDSGKVQARIRAGYIQKFDAPQETNMSQGIVVYFYNERGQQTTTMRASRGVVNEQTYDLRAEGDVLVVSDDSTKLRSERLFWDNKRRLIHTPEFVSVTSPRERVQGQGFESDQRLRNYRIFKVTAQVRTD